MDSFKIYVYAWEIRLQVLRGSGHIYFPSHFGIPYHIRYRTDGPVPLFHTCLSVSPSRDPLVPVRTVCQVPFDGPCFRLVKLRSDLERNGLLFVSCHVKIHLGVLRFLDSNMILGIGASTVKIQSARSDSAEFDYQKEPHPNKIGSFSTPDNTPRI